MEFKHQICIFGMHIAFVALAASAAELYVSPGGSDTNAGTKEAPFKTLERVQQAVRQADKNQKGETVVYLRGGTYVLSQTVRFDARDSGTEDHPVVYRAFPGETPVISGGQRLFGWGRNGEEIYQASTDGMDFRQLYVNGKKALRSRYPNQGDYLRLTDWDEKNRTILLPSGSLADNQTIDGVEIYIQMAWSISVMRLEAASKVSNGIALTVTNPERDLVFKRSHPKRVVGQAFHFENAREFIDEPGEWSLDRKKEICSYLPRAGENLASAEVVVPRLETLFAIQGTLDKPVRNLQFEGLSFEYSTWTRPSHQGYLNLQAGQYSIEPTDLDIQYVERPPAAVYAACVENLVFRNNIFKKLGAVGLDIHYGSRNSEVVGNVFYDIAGTAVSLARLSDPDVEIHTPYNPADQRDRCVNDWIHDNYIQSVGFEYGGAIGILAGYATGVKIEHNELKNLAYSGISLGWGWTPESNAMQNNSIRWNYIDAPMQLFSDGAGVYTLSEMPGSMIAGNYVTNIKRSVWSDPNTTTKCYYLDERSGGITLDRNWWGKVDACVERLFFNQPGQITILPYDRSMFKDIVKNAGLELGYRDIKKLAID